MSNKCEKCNKSPRTEGLYSNTDIVKKYFINWVCKACYFKLTGVQWKEYQEGDYDEL